MSWARRAAALLGAMLSAGGVSAPAAGDGDLIDLFSDVEARDALPDMALPAAANGTAAIPRTIEIDVAGVRSGDGRVRVLAYDDATAFARGDHGRAVGYAHAPATRGTTTLYLDTLAADPVALFAFHDENDDELINRQGARPLEGYGFSGAVDPWLPPAFDRAATADDEVTLRVNYIEMRMRR